MHNKFLHNIIFSFIYNTSYFAVAKQSRNGFNKRQIFIQITNLIVKKLFTKSFTKLVEIVTIEYLRTLRLSPGQFHTTMYRKVQYRYYTLAKYCTTSNHPALKVVIS